jgi:creatinine amidohydrolase
MDHYNLAESNWRTVKETAYEIAVLPWGATEAHNYHLPYATDNIEAEAIAHEAGRLAWAQQTKVAVLPVIPFGVNTGQHDIKLDINLNPSTQLAILDDIIATLNRHGIFKLVVLNSHGGNNFQTMLRELGMKYPKMFLCQIDWFKIKGQKEVFDDPGDHAGEMETSMMMYLKPEWVRPLNEAGNGVSKKFRFKAMQEGWGWAERQWSQVTKDTGVGDPSKSTPEKGKIFFELATHKIAGFLTDLAKTPSDQRYE